MIESTNFLIIIIIRVIRFFFPQEDIQRNRSFSATAIPTRHRTRARRPRYIIDDIELRHNINRGRIIYRARQITARNRDIAIQAEQALIDAIVQARQELEDRYVIQALRTQDERLPGRLPRQVATTVQPVQGPQV